MFDQLHGIVLHLPILTTILAAVFATLLFSRYRAKGGGLHLLWWAIGMITYALGTLTESYTTLFGWDPMVFKLWYITGAFLGGYPLAQGTIYLLMNRRFADWSARIVSTVIIIGAILVFASPVNAAAAETHRLSGKVLEWQWLRGISPILNLYSVIFLAGGAFVSAVRFRREPALRNRYLGNVLIAIGAILPGIGGAFTRFGMVEVLYITELIGLLLIFLGYRRCVRPQQEISAALRPAAAAAMVLVCLLLPVGAAAQEPPQDEPQPVSSFFEETTVTATGSKRDVFEVATPVTVIREEEIQRKQPENAADLLREQPGMDVNGVGPNQQRPVIRGQRGLRVLFLENGLRMNNARRQTDFGEITGLVDLESVSTVEVVRGPSSVLYGSDAIGGVLNLVSREPMFAAGSHLSGFAEGRYNSAGDLGGASIGVNGSYQKLIFQLGGSLRQADDYEAPAGRFGAIRLQDEVTVTDTGVEDNSFWGSVSWALSERDTLRLRFNTYQADQTGFGFVDAAAYGGDEDFFIRILYPEQSFERFTASYFGSPLQTIWADSTNVQLYFQNNERELVNDIDINIGPVGPGFPDSSVEADTRNFTDLDTWGFRADAVKATASARHIFTYGVEGYRDESFNTDFSRTRTTIRTPRGSNVSETTDAIANAPNATNTSFGLFAQDEISMTDRLRLTAGVRYHQVATRAETTPGWSIAGLDFDDDNIVGSLTATYQVTEYLNLLGSLGTAFRAPNIIERLFNGPTPEGAGFQILNPALSSETSENWDVGLKYRRWNAFMEAVVFRNDISDGIIQHFLTPAEIAALPAETRQQITASRAQFVVQQRNADRIRYEGVELVLGYHLRGLTLGGNYTFIDGERLDSTNPPTGDTYRNKVYAYARYQPTTKRYWAEYHLRHNGEDEANLDAGAPVPPVGRVLPSFTVHGVGAGLRLFETLGIKHDVTLWMENLTDELYAEFSNATFFRPEPGRTAKVSYRLSF